MNIKTIPHPRSLEGSGGGAVRITGPAWQRPLSGWPPAAKLSFFCAQEVRLQRATGVNFFLRLGTKEYVDRLEGKSRGAMGH